MKISDIVNEAPPKFYGSQCTKDCSGHKAGYQWSMLKPNRPCGGSRSASFDKGCFIAQNHRKSGKK